MKDATDIVVVGYPKSGSTWVSRLVGELVGCPVVGFLGSSHDEIAKEGGDRHSDFRCFKSHHQLHELQKFGINKKKIIYVVRDPRDICISGARYFNSIVRWPIFRDFLVRMPRGAWFYERFLRDLITTQKYRVEQMANAVIFGSENIHKWVRLPWRAHYKPYLIENCFFFVKYENLISQPEKECKQIALFLELERSEREIKKAIRAQSFEKKRLELLSRGEIEKANFMKVGKKEQWKNGLPKKTKKLFYFYLVDDLSYFGYDLF